MELFMADPFQTLLKFSQRSWLILWNKNTLSLVIAYLQTKQLTRPFMLATITTHTENCLVSWIVRTVGWLSFFIINSIANSLNLFILCVWMFWLHVWLCMTDAWCSWSSEEGILGTGKEARVLYENNMDSYLLSHLSSTLPPSQFLNHKFSLWSEFLSDKY